MKWWQTAALVVGIACMASGIAAFTIAATAVAIGLLIEGFALLLLAGTWSYMADLTLALG